MELDYIVKRCQGYGIANSLKSIKISQISTDKERQLIFLKDQSTKTSIKGSTSFTTIDDLDKYTSNLSPEALEKDTVFFIEVGVYANEIKKKDHRIDIEETNKVIDEFEIKLDIDEKLKEGFRNALKMINKSPGTYLKQEYTAQFLEFVKEIYPFIQDSILQKSIIKILNFNSIRTDGLLKEHPYTFDPEEVVVTKYSSFISDLKINDPFFEDGNDTSIDDGIVRRLAEGKISRFNGFGNAFAQVDNAQKRAGINNTISMRNHEVIDILARNKIVASPETFEELSISKLMHIIGRYKKFHLILVYPNFLGTFIYASEPSKMMEIDGSNGCVILCVFIRYILINFFGMHRTFKNVDQFDIYTC